MLEIINAGLGRTGTTSLKAALDRLGFGPVFHMFDVVADERRLGQWEEVVRGDREPDWDRIFAGYTSAVDGPCAVYYEQLKNAFPGARVMLTVRPAEQWYTSTHETLYQFSRQAGGDPDSVAARMRRLTRTMVWDGLFGGRFADRDHALAVYREHNREVVSRMGPDLFVFDVRDGWGPLCEFLGVDVPAEEFPRANDLESMRARLRGMGGGPGPDGPAAAGRPA